MSIDQYLKESITINESVLATTATLLLGSIAAFGPGTFLLNVVNKSRKIERNLDKIKNELYPELSDEEKEKFEKIQYYCQNTNLDDKPNLKKASELFHKNRKIEKVKELLKAALKSGELDDVPGILTIPKTEIESNLDVFDRLSAMHIV